MGEGQRGEREEERGRGVSHTCFRAMGSPEPGPPRTSTEHSGWRRPADSVAAPPSPRFPPGHPPPPPGRFPPSPAPTTLSTLASSWLRRWLLRGCPSSPFPRPQPAWDAGENFRSDWSSSSGIRAAAEARAPPALAIPRVRVRLCGGACVCSLTLCTCALSLNHLLEKHSPSPLKRWGFSRRGVTPG